MSFIRIPDDDFPSSWPVHPARKGAMELWQKQRDIEWNVSVVEHDLMKDGIEWKGLPGTVKTMITPLLLLFKIVDGLVVHFGGDQIKNRVDAHWVTNMLTAASAIEVVHGLGYGMAASLLFDDHDWVTKAESRIAQAPAVIAILDWAKQISKDTVSPLGTALLGAMAVEGIILQTTFAMIYALKTKSYLNGFTSLNEYIARDEKLHVDMYSWIMSNMDKKPERTEVVAIFSKAVEFAGALIDMALPSPIPDLTIAPSDVKSYSKLIANQIATVNGYEPVFPETIGKGTDYLKFLVIKDVPQFTSFHSQRPTTYTAPRVDTTADLKDIFKKMIFD